MAWWCQTSSISDNIEIEYFVMQQMYLAISDILASNVFELLAKNESLVLLLRGVYVKL